MDNKQTFFEDIDDLIANLTKAFPKVVPNDLRDLMFFIKEFSNSHPMPEDTRVLVDYVYPEGLEILNTDKVSDVLIQGVEKYKSLDNPNREIPPIVVLRQGIRSVMIFGEMNAVEAYTREQPLRAIILELDSLDIFETFGIDQRRLVFFVPYLQEQMRKK
ncbi:MAG: hypothetical protein PHS44_06460 [Candidatus Dojkabacteria bacterium]|nr:hypothetical protein [Candidatus Dojkabacteria bacterium]